jgi:hypothetical protein
LLNATNFNSKSMSTYRTGNLEIEFVVNIILKMLFKSETMSTDGNRSMVISSREKRCNITRLFE